MIVITPNHAISRMADRIIQVKNGCIIGMETNPAPLEVEKIEW